MKSRKTTVRKMISGLLAMAMVLTVIQAGLLSVFALQEGDFTYTVSGSEATITGYTNSGVNTNLVLPETLGGYPVVAIGNRAFENQNGLTSITISKDIRTLGEACFAFSYINYIFVDSANTYFKSVGQSLYSFDYYVLYWASPVPPGTYTILNMVRTIYPYAFAGCSAMTGVNFGSNVGLIGSYAFYKSGLTSITIPESVVIIDQFNAFRECAALTQINVAEANPNYSSLNGVLFNEAQNRLISYPCGKSGDYDIPPGVTIIDSEAFFACKLLTGVSIPEGITALQGYQFASCEALHSVELPSTLTSIGNNCFWYADLTNIYIPANVNSIANGAFIDSNLSFAFFLGNAPDSFGSNVFDYAAAGFKVNYLNENSGFSNPWHGYAAEPFEPHFSPAPTVPTNGNVTLTIVWPDISTVMEYKIGAEPWTAYTEPLVLTENCDVWARCSDDFGIDSPEILYSINNIDRLAPVIPTLAADPLQPTDEPVIITITYPGDAVTREYRVGAGGWEEYTDPFKLGTNDTVYARCADEAGNESDIGSIVINYIGFYDYKYEVIDSETIITGYGGAGGDIVIPETLGTFPVVEIATGAFQDNDTLNSVVIPDNVRIIGAAAFRNCFGLSSVTLPEMLTLIDESAFAHCTGLKSIVIPAEVTDIRDTAFYDCSALIYAYFLGDAPDRVGSAIFDGALSGFVVYFRVGANGFEDPWYYKTLPFEPQISALPTTPTNGNVTVTIEYPAPSAVTEYKINDGAWVDYTTPVILTLNGTVYARCFDEFGYESKEVEITVSNIDKIPPDAPVLSATPLYETTGYVTVTVTFPGDAAIRQYALESAGGIWAAYTGPIVLWENDIVYARCFDEVGNESGTESVVVDNIIKITEGIIEKRGSTTVINPKENLIYGLAPGITKDEFEHDYIETVGEVKIYYTPDTTTLGTGTRVDVYNGFEERIASYLIVIFGDVNGDGNISGIDAGIIVNVENYMLVWDNIIDAALIKAGDVNGDGNFTGIDAGIMVDVENYMRTINQVTGL